MEKSRIIKDLTCPLVTDNVLESIEVFDDPYEAVKESYAVVICTEWDEFKVNSRNGKTLISK